MSSMQIFCMCYQLN